MIVSDSVVRVKVTAVEKTVLKAVEPLRMLEQTWRVQTLQESTIQSSLFIILHTWSKIVF